MLNRLFGAACTLALLSAGTALAVQSQKPGSAEKMYVVGVLSGIHVVDMATGLQRKVIETGTIPHNLLKSPDSRLVYVSNIGSQSVSVIDTRTDSKVRDILVGQIPDIAPHRKLGPAAFKGVGSCYVCHKDNRGSMPNALTWSGDQRHLIVTQARDRSLAWIDTQSGRTEREIRVKLPDPAMPANTFVHPKTKEVWVVHRFEKHLPAKPASLNAPFDHTPAGQHASWVTIHDPELKHELARIRMPWSIPFDGTFSPDGRWLYVAYRSSNKIAVFDTRTRRMVRSMDTGVSPVGIALSNDGKELYVTCLFANPAVVQVLDVASGKIKVSMGIPPSPSLVVQDPASGYIYVTATGYNKVLEIDPKRQALLRELPSGHQPLDLLLLP